MKQLCNITSENFIKIVNTVSHIIYYEITGEMFTSLRNNLVELQDLKLTQYKQFFEQITIDGDIKSTYKIVVPFYLNKDDEKSKKGYDKIYINFVEGIDKIYVYNSLRFFVDTNSDINIFCPTIKDLEAEDQCKHLSAMFTLIFLHYAGYSIDTRRINIVSPGLSMINTLSRIIANVIIDVGDENIDSNISKPVNVILDQFSDSTSKYIKLTNTIDFDYILQLYSTP